MLMYMYLGQVTSPIAVSCTHCIYKAMRVDYLYNIINKLLKFAEDSVIVNFELSKFKMYNMTIG